MSTNRSELSVRGDAIQKFYTDFLGGKYLVNRRYQRKLVWTLEEKQALIDSILADLPIPLILVAADPLREGAHEVIDGMQRLNAIASFIENQFPVHGQYFDLSTLADTLAAQEKGTLTQETPVMPKDDCLKIANYSIPVSVFRSSDANQVDEIFRRINSSGRTLSRQELRQAGSTAPVAECVRRISSRIRQDSTTSDTVDLREMPQLSINNRNLPYGINVDDIFWVKQNILRRDDMRASYDEQAVLDVLVDIVTDLKENTGPASRDAAYSFTQSGDDRTESQKGDRISKAFAAADMMKLEENFFYVFDQFRLAVGEDTSFVRLITGKGSGSRYGRYFHAVFMAFWRLIMLERKVLKDSQCAHSRISQFAAKQGKELSIPGGGGDWTAAEKGKSVRRVMAEIEVAFEQRPADGEEDFALYSYASRVEAILSNARVEQRSCEFKQGLLPLSATNRTSSEKLWAKIAQTACAMSNMGPNKRGYILIGIAEDEGTAKEVASVDGIRFTPAGDNFLVGVGREAECLGKTLKEYFDWVMDKLGGLPISSELRSSIKSESFLASLHGHDIIVIPVTPGSGPAFYDKDLYVRNAGGNELLPPERYATVFSRFA